MTSNRALAVSPALVLALMAPAVLACSVESVEAWWEHGVYISRWYWAATAVLGVAVVYVAKLRSRALPTIAIVLLATAFHPSWTVTPMWGPDCEHSNVFASKFVIALLILMLAYQAFRLFKHRRGPVGLAQ
jgi:hypothetical protein